MVKRIPFDATSCTAEEIEEALMASDIVFTHR
jgi:hypothetical protein